MRNIKNTILTTDNQMEMSFLLEKRVSGSGYD